MTIQELYGKIGGDYEQALRVLRMDKLLDKHIRKLTTSGVIDRVLEAGKSPDPNELFEAAHAMKGVCANLGLTRMAEAASELAEEFRPGTGRRLSDGEVADRIRRIGEMYRTTAEEIRKYEEG